MPKLEDVTLTVSTKSDNKGIDQSESKLEQFVGRVQKLAVAAAGAWATKKVIEFGQASLTAAGNFQQSVAGFETFLGSHEAALEAVRKIQKDAADSPLFGQAELIKGNQLLISAGISAEQARGDIAALGNAIAATGGGNAELMRVVQNMQQIQNVGQASAVDIKQFGFAGINIMKLVADATGKTVEELDGIPLTYEVISAALQKASDEGGVFAGAQERAAATINGAWAGLSDQVDILMTNIGLKLNETFRITEGMQLLGEWISNLSQMIQTGSIPQLGAFTDAWNMVQEFINMEVRPTFERIYAKLEEFVTEVAPYVQKALDTFAQWWNENSETILAIVRVVWSLIELVIKTAIDLISGALRVGLAIISGDWGAAWEAIKDTFSSIWDNMVNFAETRFNDLMTILRSGLNWAIDKMNDLIDKIPLVGDKIDIPGFANGVTNFDGGLAVVGERGPELVNLPRGSDVIPAGRTRDMLKGGSGVSIETVNINNGVDLVQFQRELAFAVAAS